MDVSEEKQIVKKFYIIALVLNVVIPFLIGKIIIGDSTTIIQLLYIAIWILSILNAMSFAVYFLIPGFESKRDKNATLFFPSILLLGLCVVELNFIYFLAYTLIQNLVFFFWWIQKRKL